MFKIFRITTSTSNRFIKFVHKRSNYIDGIGACSLVVFAVSSLLAMSIQFMSFLLPVAYIALTLFAMCMILEALVKIPLSLRCFMGYGFLYWFIVSLIIYFIASLLIHIDHITSVLLVYIIFGFTWIIYSLLVNNTVARLANFLISSVLAILVLLKDFILTLIPEGYAGTQEIEIVVNLILTPVLIINIMAMAICELKGYWIEKYNDGKDVGDE